MTHTYKLPRLAVKTMRGGEEKKMRKIDAPIPLYCCFEFKSRYKNTSVTEINLPIIAEDSLSFQEKGTCNILVEIEFTIDLYG